MKIRITIVATLSLLLLASTALAQDDLLTSSEYGVRMTRPDGWEDVEGNERAVFNIKHDDSQSQIEVIATQLMSADVATVFYDTFHETLEQSSFELQGSETQTFGEHEGDLTEYRFEYAGVALRVVIFAFTHESTAFLVVGYIKDDQYETHITSFEAAVGSIEFTTG